MNKRLHKKNITKLKNSPREMAIYLKRKYPNHTPIELAHELKILVFAAPLQNTRGMYRYMQRTKCVYLNNSLLRNNCLKVFDMVAYHEIGHSIFDPKINSEFIGNKTLSSTSANEVRANTFSAEMIIDDESMEYFREHGYNFDQMAAALGVHPLLVKLKYNSMYNTSV